MSPTKKSQQPKEGRAASRTPGRLPRPGQPGLQHAMIRLRGSGSVDLDRETCFDVAQVEETVVLTVETERAGHEALGFIFS